jgi:hypothetical protein
MQTLVNYQMIITKKQQKQNKDVNKKKTGTTKNTDDYIAKCVKNIFEKCTVTLWGADHPARDKKPIWPLIHHAKQQLTPMVKKKRRNMNS